jgi:DNA-binding MarR family transcriptional regulator
MRQGAVPRDAPDADLVLYRLMLVAGFVGAEFATRFGRHRLTLPEWRVLLELHREGADSAADIARRTGLSAMNVSRAVAAQRELGRIQRAPDPEDGRRQLLALTPRGRALVEKVLPEGQATARALLDGIPRGEHAALAEALARVIEAARARAEARSRTGPRPARRGA